MSDEQVSFPRYPTLPDVLSVDRWTVEHMEALVRDSVVEGRSIEFKDGAYFDDHLRDGDRRLKKERRTDFLRVTVGFANAAGGVLIVGIKEEKSGKESVAAAPSPFSAFTPAAGLVRWVSDLLSAVFPAIRPDPDVQVVDDPAGGRYLVVVVRPSASGLLCLPGSGRSMFPARLGEQTIDLDDWAVQAILHGSRRSPELRLVPNLESTATLQATQGRTDDWRIALPLRLSNRSFVWAESLTWGLLVPVLAYRRNSRDPIRTPSQVDADFAPEAVIEDGVRPWLVQPTARSVLPRLAPHAVDDLLLTFGLRLPEESRGLKVRLAFYVVCSNLLPSWWSITVCGAVKGTVETIEVRSVDRAPVGLDLFVPRGSAPADEGSA